MAGSIERGVGRSGARPNPAPDFGLAWHVGSATLNRARGIVAGGSILDLQVVQQGELAATVIGTRPWPYETDVRFSLARGEVKYFESSCDCPMESDCKHGVAALLQHLMSTVPGAQISAARPQSTVLALPAQPAAWERSLNRLLGTPPATAHHAARERTLLGLQFAVSVSEPDNLLSPAQIGIRPMQRNAKGRWVTSGVSWRDLRYAQYTGQYLPDQLECLRAVVEAQGRRTPWEAPPTWITANGQIGPGIWDLLERAAETGVEFGRGGQGTGDVEIAGEPARVTIDVTRASTLAVTPTIRLDGDVLHPSRMRLIGDPAHGVIIWRDGPITSPGRVVLARLHRTLSKELGQLIATGRIPVPESDEQRFFAEFVPRLRRMVTLESSDGSVVIPERAAPRLQVCVHHEPDHGLRVVWDWIDEEAGRRRELADDRGLVAGDRAAMRAALEQIISLGVLSNGMLSHDGRHLEPECSLTGTDTIDFLHDAWPALLEIPWLTTEVFGTPLDYRVATGEPVIEVDGDDALAGDWFDLAVSVTVDQQRVPFELIFRALASGGSPVIILPSGTYFTLEGGRWDTLRNLIEEARGLHDLPPNHLRVDRYTTSRWDDLEASGLLGEQATAWRDRVRALAPAQPPPAPLPATFKAELRGYQQEGFDWLVSLQVRGLGGILADDMGLGKTVQTLGLIAHAREKSTTDGPFLVVAPTSVMANWAAESRRFTPDLRVELITEGRSRRGRDLGTVVAGADIVITSYALFRLEYSAYEALPWSGLILDEAQFVKNQHSKGFRCAKSLPTTFKLAVTGTPLENNLAELWALLSITAPGLFPDAGRFTEYYRSPIERGQAPARLDQLRRRVGPFLLRRTKEEVATDLPPKQEQVVEVELSPRHQQVYQRHLQRERQKILGLIQDENALDANRFLILRSLTMLRQLSLDPSLVDDEYADIPSSKLDVVMEQLASIVDSGHRVLVFSQFTRFLGRARDRLDALGIGHCQLDGKTRNRAEVIERFQAGDAPVFLISLKAGGFGLNLTEADYCILLDPWWNPAAEAQAIDRTHRIGQTKSVMVYRYVAKATIEEKVMALKAGKARLFNDVLGKGDGSGAARVPLSAAEIRELIA
jgi:superfamily II DNA or RNA helicase